MSAIAITTTVLASAVANAGTLVVNYPTGSTQASLIGSTGGQVSVEGNLWPQASSGAGTIALTFGSSNITITNNSGVTWAAGATLIASFGDTTKSGSYNNAIRTPAPVALTAATGTASDTIADVTAAFSQTVLNNNFKSLADKLNAALTALKNAGITV